MFSSAGNVLLLAFGFGFVIFWHELGHFLAAKWADVKVEQFAVGFGQALFSWRQGLGFRWGSSQTEYQAKLRAEVERTTGRTLQPAADTAAAAGAATLGDLPTDPGPRVEGDPSDAELTTAGRTLNLSETEYRLNWIPLGGYVKMLGQDDLRPGVDVPDPRSYTSKPVGKRMVIVSAGVTMNVILAFIGFMVYFSVGPHVPKPQAGRVLPGSPASLAVRVLPNGKTEPAPIEPGDTILALDGRAMAEFDKIRLNTPLLIAGDAVPITVRRADGHTVETLMVTPLKAGPESEFPQLGIAACPALAPAKPLTVEPAAKPFDPLLDTPEMDLIHPGESIVAIEGKPVTGDGFPLLMARLQALGGKALPVTVLATDGKKRLVSLPAHFEDRFHDDDPIEFAGLQMLPRVSDVDADSTLKGQLLPGDVVVDVADVGPSGGHHPDPTRDQLVKFIHDTADAGGQVRLTVRRHGQVQPPLPAVTLNKSHKLLGAAFDLADTDLTVADPPANTPAATAHVPPGAVLKTVDGKSVTSWFDVFAAVCNATADRPISIVTTVDDQPRTYTLPPLDAAELMKVRSNRLVTSAEAALPPNLDHRKADNVFQAARWGVGETRDAIVQVYLTVRAMIRGSIGVGQVSGPLGILAVGYKFAEAGSLRLLWFLSIISANLAVMNFLPIPVVDGGLFTFLVIEKIKGSPISQRTQSVAQMVGLALLLSVFLFATYQDLFRIPLLFH